MLTRREFVIAGGTALAAFSVRAEESDGVPAILDHILLGCRDLDEGVAFVETKTGVHAAFGGVHPGRGTQNALLSLGERCYLEIIAPDPKQQGAKVTPMVREELVAELKALVEPRLVGWAAHPGELAGFAKRLHEAGIGFSGPSPGSRKRPDGRVLQWQTLNLNDDDSGLLPFFIEWSADSPHPASDAPKGCRMEEFELIAQDTDQLEKKLAVLSLDVRLRKGPKTQIRVRIAGPKGELEMTS